MEYKQFLLQTLKKILKIGSIVLIIAYIFLFIFVERIERFATFPGTDVNLKELVQHPAGIIAAEDIYTTTGEGERIHGIYIDNEAEKTVFYFHGNGAPMQYFYTEKRYIGDLGYNVMSFDYPGYGNSEGEPTQKEVREFADTFYDYVTEKKDIADEDIIIWGYSVGTAVAIDFAKDRDFDKLVLFSPFASRYDIARKAFGFAPQKLVFHGNSYNSAENIKNIDEATLIIHGNTDIVVPFEQGRDVYQNSGAKEKYFIEIDNFGHSLITERYGDVLAYYITDFLNGKGLESEYTFLDREKAEKLLSR